MTRTDLQSTKHQSKHRLQPFPQRKNSVSFFNATLKPIWYHDLKRKRCEYHGRFHIIVPNSPHSTVAQCLLHPPVVVISMVGVHLLAPLNNKVVQKVDGENLPAVGNVLIVATVDDASVPQCDPLQADPRYSTPQECS